MSAARDTVALPNLPAALKDIDESQKSLADYLGVSEATVSRLIRGHAKMLTRERIEQLERFTGRTFDYLADLKRSELSDQEVADLSALRNAPPEVQQLVRLALAPYRTKS